MTTTSPFGPLVVIANPRSGRGKVGARLAEIERILTSAGLAYRVVRTTHPGHATEAARDALARGVVTELPRTTKLGPGTGVWHQIPAGGETLRVHRRFFKDLDTADAALTAV